MNIIELLKRQDISENIPLNKIYIQFGEFLNELREKKLPNSVIESVNQDIAELNSTTLTGNDLKKLVKKKQTENLKMV